MKKDNLYLKGHFEFDNIVDDDDNDKNNKEDHANENEIIETRLITHDNE